MNSVFSNKLVIAAGGLALVVAALLVGLWLSSGDSLDPVKAISRDVAGVLVLKNGHTLLPEKQMRRYEYLENMEVWFSIYGLKSQEQELTETDSALSLTPRFVAFLKTNAWNWQMQSVVSGPVSDFVKRQLGDKAKSKKGVVSGRDVFHWQGQNGREAFVFLQGSTVIIANDREALVESFKVLDNKKESLSELLEFSDFLESNRGKPLVGYFPKRALTEFAAAAGVTAAVNSSEGTLPRLAISQILPGILKNNVNSILWTSKREKNQIVDEFEFVLEAEAKNVFSETLKKSPDNKFPADMLIPKKAESYTAYNFARPQIAFRSLLLVAGKDVGGPVKSLLPAIFSSLFQPYGVEDAEKFLSGTGNRFVTVTFEDEEESLVVFEVKDRKLVAESLVCCLKPAEDEEYIGISEDFELAIKGDIGYLGTRGSVKKALENGVDAAKQLADSSEVAVLTVRSSQSKSVEAKETVQTSSTGRSIVRKSVTEQGMIGSFIEGN